MKNNYNVDVEHLSGPNGCAPECEACKPAAHTPTPWKFNKDAGQEGTQIRQSIKQNDYLIATVWPDDITDREQADSAFIVRAVNAHEELLAIAKDALSINEEYERKTGVTTAQTKRVRDAIAKAEGRI